MKLLAISPAIRLEVREFLRLALPLASAQVAQALTGFVANRSNFTRVVVMPAQDSSSGVGASI